MQFHVGRLIDHVHLRVSDLAASKRFYRAVFAALGKSAAFVEAPDHFSADELWVDEADGPVSRVHLAFQAADRAMVEAFHRAALAAGGRDNGGPGERRYHPGYYAAFALDPDGNNIEAVFHGAATRSADSVVVTPVAQPAPTAEITQANPSVAEMEARVARFRALRPTDDYRDSAIPGCERTTYRVLGTQPAAPLAAEGFHLNIVRCEPGKSAPLHSHLTQEVFVALTGRWEVFWGPLGERSVRLEPWDTISVPPGLSRGFRNVGAEPAYLMGMASGRDPGNIDWPEQVRAAARAVGVDLR